ncbi:MAG: hypothetical protein D6707_07850 [Bacteroidetes bacterium]|nr:MAG: hypothetical protein D6707_07850 [Bacteroidota bacterium]
MQINKYILLLFVTVWLSVFCKSQNLLLNGDFEQYWECPNSPLEISSCKYTFNPALSTSDYYHACMEEYVPRFFLGYQYPQSGNAYVGIVGGPAVEGREFPWQEYVQMKLKRVLQEDEKVFFFM